LRAWSLAASRSMTCASLALRKRVCPKPCPHVEPTDPARESAGHGMGALSALNGAHNISYVFLPSD
jgi:hypothetical protein